jgi:hypothetical protein
MTNEQWDRLNRQAAFNKWFALVGLAFLIGLFAYGLITGDI